MTQVKEWSNSKLSSDARDHPVTFINIRFYEKPRLEFRYLYRYHFIIHVLF